MKPIRFKLRTLMIVTFVIATVLGLYSERALRQRRIVNQLLAKKGIPFYTIENGTPFAQQFIASDSDFWNHFRYSIKMVVLQPSAEQPTDDQLPIVAKLPSIDYLYIWPGGVKNSDNQPFQRHADGGLTDDGIAVLIADLTHLRHFVTTSANCSQARLYELDEAMKSTEFLSVAPHNKSSCVPLHRK